MAPSWLRNKLLSILRKVTRAPCGSTFDEDIDGWDVGQVTTFNVRLAGLLATPPHTLAMRVQPTAGGSTSLCDVYVRVRATPSESNQVLFRLIFE